MKSPLQQEPLKPEKRANIRDVAREAGVSHTTVSLILNGKNMGTAETKARVFQAAEKLNYQPDALFRKAMAERTRRKQGGAKRTQTHILGFLLPHWMAEQVRDRDGYYSRLLMGATKAAAELGYHILLCPHDNSPGIPEVIQDDKVDGLLLEGAIQDHLLSVLTRRLPCVYMNWYIPGYQAIFVTTNWPACSMEQIKYAWQQGHRNFVFHDFEADEKHLLGTHRFLSLALEEMGGKLLHPELSRVRPRQNPTASVEEFVEEFMCAHPRPTMIFCADTPGVLITRALKARGLRVPEDVSIISRHGHISGKYNDPPLTSYEYPNEEIAAQATRLLIQSIQSGKLHPAHMMLEGRIRERASIAPIEPVTPGDSVEEAST